VVGKAPGQKLIRVIPANSNLRALAPTLLLQQMCKPDQLINFQSVRSVKIPVMSSQVLTGVSSTQQPVVVPFQAQAIKKDPDASLVESLWHTSSATIKQETEQVKVEPSESRKKSTFILFRVNSTHLCGF